MKKISKDNYTMKAYDTLGGIMAYEGGEMDEDEVIIFFQHLVDTGMAWTLQGSYGRTAAALIRNGDVLPSNA